MNLIQRTIQVSVKTCLLLVAGLLYAIGVKYFIVPSKVILTGFEGIALSVSYFFDKFQYFVLLYAIFQTILLIFAFFVLSKKFAFSTGFIVATIILCLEILPPMSFASPEAEKERLILVLFGGLIIGAAKALAFKNRGSLGDEDIIATYVSQKKMQPVGSIALLAGSVSTLFGVALMYIKSGDFESTINTLMYTSIYIFVSAVTLNRLFKKYQLTSAIIITQKPHKVSSAISKISNQRSHTIQDCMGGYSKQPKHLISAILPHDELNEFLICIKKEDPQAFVYFHDIEGVYGSFFINPIS